MAETLIGDRPENVPPHFVQDVKTGEWFDPYVDDFGYELECTHCGGDGTCDDGSDPLLTCPDELHPCHACNGSGKRRDQRIF